MITQNIFGRRRRYRRRGGRTRFPQSGCAVSGTSSAEKDKLATYSHSVAGYITKANAGTEFRDLIQMLGNYSQINEFPVFV